MSTMVKCKCGKGYYFNPNFKCNLCNSFIPINQCVQCHNKMNDHFVPLTVKYHIRRSSMFGIQIGLYGLLATAFIISLRMVSL
jgi:hypothetical protein